ncbi:MAG: endonuclease/exonuclease/phosphatase family protein [Bdellovibrionia bacterium]
MGEKKIVTFSYNIHKGFSLGNRRFVLNRMRSVLRELHPDLIFLQEVLGQHDSHEKKIKDWPSEPQFEFLAHELWPHYAYGRNAVYSSGHHGNAILSKFPFSFYENIDISSNPFEKRGLLHGVLEVPGKKSKPLHVICIHLGLLEGDREEQTERLCARIQSHVPPDEPLVIGGDFNDWRGRISRVLHSSLGLKEAFHTIHGAHAKTFPSWYPALKLDRIYYRGLSVRGAHCFRGRPWVELSDHSALWAELLFER